MRDYEREWEQYFSEPETFPLDIQREFFWGDRRMKLVTWWHVEYRATPEELWPLDKRNTKLLLWTDDWKPVDHTDVISADDEEKFFDVIMDMTMQRYVAHGGEIIK